MGKMLIIGTSPNPKKYSYTAVRKLLFQRNEVIPIGTRGEMIGTCPIITDKPVIENVNLIILYVNSEKQQEYYNYILQLNPKKILFNPGTENPELARIAYENNIDIQYDCALTLVDAQLLE